MALEYDISGEFTIASNPGGEVGGSLDYDYRIKVNKHPNYGKVVVDAGIMYRITVQYNGITKSLAGGEVEFDYVEKARVVTFLLDENESAQFWTGAYYYYYDVVLNFPSTASISASNVHAGSNANVSWKFSDPEGDPVTVRKLKRYIKAKGSSTWTSSNISVSSSATSYSDAIPAEYRGGEVYWEIEITDKLDVGRDWTYGLSSTATSPTYTISVPNSAPTTPGVPAVPDKIKEGDTISVSWGASSDADGNLAGYQLQASLDNGSWTTVYTGASTAIAYTIPKGTKYIAFRVCAYDSSNAYSGYATTATFEVVSALSGYISVNQIQRNIVGGYAFVDGVAREIVGAYVCVNGVWRSCSGGSGKANLPSGYTATEYVDLNGRQYIDTKFVVGGNTRVILDFEVTSMNATTAILGGRNSVQSKTFTMFYYNNTYRSDYNTTQMNIAVDAVGRHMLDANKNVWLLDGVSVTHNASSFSGDYTLYIGSLNNAGVAYSSGLVGKIYSCKVYDNGTLIRDYVPCKNASGKSGFWDMITQTFNELQAVGGANIASGYTQLDYIESTGTQYIDTGFWANNLTRVVVEAVPLDIRDAGNSQGFIPYGAAEKYNSRAFECYSQGNQFEINYGSNYEFITNVVSGEKVTIDQNKNSVIISKPYENVNMVLASSTFSAPFTIGLFGTSRASKLYSGPMRLYSCKIYDNGTLKRDYIPCIAPSGQVGLFNSVDNTFVTNSGTGSFVASPI